MGTEQLVSHFCIFNKFSRERPSKYMEKMFNFFLWDFIQPIVYRVLICSLRKHVLKKKWYLVICMYLISWIQASPTWWAWVWVNSRSWWWTGRPGVLRFSRTRLSDWTELNWTDKLKRTDHVFVGSLIKISFKSIYKQRIFI